MPNSWYNRDYSGKIIKSARSYPVLVLTGARQTGKTTLISKLFPDHNYVSLDIPSLAALAEKSPSEFLEKYPAPLIIDEVQYAPGLFRHLKVAVDKDRHNMGQFILTGSQKFTLMKEVSDSLAGRSAIFELETLSLNEIVLHQNYPKNSNEWASFLVRGGFPELWRNTEAELDVFFGSYLSTYLERDVRQILNVTSLRDFERFMRVCAARNGQILEKSAIAAEVGVSSKAINSWISVLEASNQIVLLEPWFRNFGKRIVKSPKMYFNDSGLVCYLLGVSKENIIQSPFIGAIWEGYCFGEIRKSSRTYPAPKSIWFYRDKQQVEVDFLVIGGGQASLIECKWNENPDKRDAKHVEKIMGIAAEKKLPDFQRQSGFVLSRTDSDYPITEKIKAVNLESLQSIF